MPRATNPIVTLLVLLAACLFAASGGCGSHSSSGLGDDGGGSSGSGSTNFNGDDGGSGGSSGGFASSGGGAFAPGDGGSANNCPPGSPLSCYVSTCSGGAHTTITGKVYDPAGVNPLYNIVVFVPNDVTMLPAIETGTKTCNSCNTPVGDYVSVALTDKTGSFTLQDVPTGTNVPLVVQVGKWRRVITVPTVADCATTTLPDSGDGQARLPRKRSEGDMPQMALLTGGLDNLGCFLTRMGIDSSEYSAPGAGGRLDIYQGFGLGGAPGPGLSNGTPGNCTNTDCPLWKSIESFQNYDIVLLACEGDPYDPDGVGLGLNAGAYNVTKAGKQALHDWLNEGGKVFATHFHYTWFQNGPSDFTNVATWLGGSAAFGTCDECTIDTSFTKGQTLHDWLGAVNGLDGNGVTLTGVATSISTVNKSTSQRWIYQPPAGSGTEYDKYFSFETPIGGMTTDAGESASPQYCGKAVFTDLHAGGAPSVGAGGSTAVPAACKPATLTHQEKALEFLFFDLAACVTDDTKPPPIPPQPPK